MYLDGTAHKAGTGSVALDLVVQAVLVRGEVKGLGDTSREILHCLGGLATLQTLVASIQPAGGARRGGGTSEGGGSEEGGGPVRDFHA